MFWFIEKEHALHSWKDTEDKRCAPGHTRSHKLAPGYPVLQASVLLTAHSRSALRISLPQQDEGGESLGGLLETTTVPKLPHTVTLPKPYH